MLPMQGGTKIPCVPSIAAAEPSHSRARTSQLEMPTHHSKYPRAAKQGKKKYKGPSAATTNHYMQIKWKTLEEIDKSLEMYNLPRLSWEETENMNRPIISTENETD